MSKANRFGQLGAAAIMLGQLPMLIMHRAEVTELLARTLPALAQAAVAVYAIAVAAGLAALIPSRSRSLGQ